VITEQRHRERIRSHGFAPQRRLLLLGQPGTGKTMTASALAGELGLPLFVIQLDALITKFMGETAAKLRLIFDGLESTRGVYLFDEVDALGSKRGAQNDVGEIRRVLNSFLQFLERDESESLIIGATNHPELLDRALFRRFDAVIEYELPPKELARRVIQARLSLLHVADIDWDSILAAADGLSHAEIRHHQSLRISGQGRHPRPPHPGPDGDLLGALNERRTTHRSAPDGLLGHPGRGEGQR
jgi:SpoVK/Ycf46/Vps4 family AAA+-type ATPase